MARDVPPTLMHRVKALHDKGLTQTQIATTIGMEQPYVSKLLIIATKLDPSIVAKWEKSWEGSIRVPLNALRDLHDRPHSEQREQYNVLYAEAEATKANHRHKLSQSRNRHTKNLQGRTPEHFKLPIDYPR